VPLSFAWDEEKASANRAKHGVSFEEAKTVFNDPFAVTIHDPDHSRAEDRYIDAGTSASGRVLVVWYIERGRNIRIIGCRKASRSERRSYEEDRHI